MVLSDGYKGSALASPCQWHSLVVRVSVSGKLRIFMARGLNQRAWMNVSTSSQACRRTLTRVPTARSRRCRGTTQITATALPSVLVVVL